MLKNGILAKNLNTSKYLVSIRKHGDKSFVSDYDTYCSLGLSPKHLSCHLRGIWFPIFVSGKTFIKLLLHFVYWRYDMNDAIGVDCFGF